MYGFRDVVRTINQRITAGVYPPDSALPSRLELLAEFGVARVTLDRAIRELETEHKLICKRGAGTFVLPPQQHRCVIAWVGNPSAEMRAALKLPNRIILPETLQQPSAWTQLFDFDGILWDCPGDFLLPAIERFQGKIPQVVINRILSQTSCVSTDHGGAFREIVLERLQKHPDGIPILLQTEPKTLPTQYRFEGFAAACRENQHFYELWSMPEDFKAACQLLRTKFAQLDPARPWLIFADSKHRTGAVMRIAAEKHWQWQKQHFYCDFDNDQLPDVWGCRVSSFIQDLTGLRQEAEKMLHKMIKSQDFMTPQLKLLYPKRINGDT